MSARHGNLQHVPGDLKPTRAWDAAAGLAVGGGASIAAFVLLRRALIASHWRFDVADAKAWDMLGQYLPLYWQRGVPADALWLFAAFAAGLLVVLAAFGLGLFLGRFLGSPLRVVVLTLADTAGALLSGLWALFASAWRRRRGGQTPVEDDHLPRRAEVPPHSPTTNPAETETDEPDAARPRTRPRLTIGLNDGEAGPVEESVEEPVKDESAAKTSDAEEPDTPGLTATPPQLADLLRQVTGHTDEDTDASTGDGRGNEPAAVEPLDQPQPVDDLRAAAVRVLRDLNWETLTDVHVNADYAMDFEGDRFDGDPGARIPLVALSPDEVLLVFFADLHGAAWTAASPDEVTAGLPPWFSDGAIPPRAELEDRTEHPTQERSADAEFHDRELESPVARAVRAKFRFELHHAPVLERAGLIDGTVLPLVLACNGSVEDPDAVMAPWSRDHALLKVVGGKTFQRLSGGA